MNMENIIAKHPLPWKCVPYYHTNLVGDQEIRDANDEHVIEVDMGAYTPMLDYDTATLIVELVNARFGYDG